MVAVSGGETEVARMSATVSEKNDCVQRFLRTPMGSPNHYNSGARAAGHPDRSLQGLGRSTF